MADMFEEAEFWLPSGFLTDDDLIFTDNNKDIQRSTTASCFPAEFPYDFDSVINSSDEEDQLAELTRQITLPNHYRRPVPSQQNFEKNRVISGSPQSTLTRFGSWLGPSPGSSDGGSPKDPSVVSSSPPPPATPFDGNDDVWGLIYQAAGQVAKLNINGSNTRAQFVPCHCHPSISTADSCYNTCQRRCGARPDKEVNDSWFYEERQRGGINRGRLRFEGLMENEKRGKLQASWSSMQQYHRLQYQRVRPYVEAAYQGGNLGGNGVDVRKPRAGTGVFLPRCYGNDVNSNLAKARKKLGCSTARPPTGLGHSQFESHFQPHCKTG